MLRNVLVVLHFVGLASLPGGVLVQSRLIRRGEARILAAIMHGVWIQLITGIALANREKERPGSWVVPTISILTLADIVISVFWH